MRKLTRTGLALAATSALAAAGAMVPVAAEASSKVPTITATMKASSISLSGSHTIHAGRVHFKVTTASGDHTLQILKIVKRGYTMQQAGKDVNDGFSGKVAAIRRIDTNIRWLGGAEATPGHNGHFAETLYAGKYVFIDQSGPGVTTLTVTGSPADRSWIANNSSISAVNYGFKTTSTLPKSGWTLFKDSSDEPHFLVLQQVKPGTTAKDVNAYIKSGSQDQPSWALPFNVSSGVISPKTQIEWHYSAPAGHYILACFWPDDTNGMPHFFMGMWKLVTLK